MIHFEVRQEPH